MATINLTWLISFMPIWLAALLPTNPIISESQRIRLWALIFTPSLATGLILNAYFSNDDSFLATVYFFSIFNLLSPLTILRFYAWITIISLDEVGLTPSIDQVIAATLYIISIYALTIAVATVIRPPRPFTKNKIDERRRSELCLSYLFHIFATPLALYTILQLIAMVMLAASTLNQLTLERKARMAQDIQNTCPYNINELLFDAGVFSYIVLFTGLVIQVNLWFLGQRTTNAMEYLHTIRTIATADYDAAPWTRASIWDMGERSYELNNRPITIRWADAHGLPLVSGAQEYSESSVGIAMLEHEQRMRFRELALQERRDYSSLFNRSHDDGNEADSEGSDDSEASDDSEGSFDTLRLSTTEDRNAGDGSSDDSESDDTAGYDPQGEELLNVDIDVVASGEGVAKRCIAE